MPCIFCGQLSVTKAHVLPEWLKNITVKPEKLGEYTINAPPSRGAPVLYAKNARIVCQERCNGGWMSRIEDAATDVVTPLVQAQSCVLHPVGQAILSRWAALAALLTCYLHEPKPIPVPRDYPSLFYYFKEPPPITGVWIASYDLLGGKAEGYKRGPLRIPWSRVPPLLRPAGTVTPQDINGYRVTINVFHLAFLVMVLQPPPGWYDNPVPIRIDLNREVPGAKMIWPTPQAEGIRWPITPTVDDLGMSFLANAQPIVTPIIRR